MNDVQCNHVPGYCRCHPLPCPFCGGEVDGIEDANEGIAYTPNYFIQCRTCDCRSPEFRDDKEAVAWWNRRTPAPSPPNQMTPSEAVYAFAGWLTGRREVVTWSARHDASSAAECADAFCKSQGFADPRDKFGDFLKPYPVPAESGQTTIPAPSSSSETLCRCGHRDHHITLGHCYTIGCECLASVLPETLTKEPRIAEISARLEGAVQRASIPTATVRDMRWLLSRVSELEAEQAKLKDHSERADDSFFAIAEILGGDIARLSAENEWLMALGELAAMDVTDVSFDHDNSVVWAIRCNDYFVPAADAEPITGAEAVSLVARIAEHPDDAHGVCMAWIATKRGVPNQRWRAGSPDESSGDSE